MSRSIRSVRFVHALLIAVTIPLGLASRVRSLPMPELARTYGGDVLSATCIFFGVMWLLHTGTVARNAIIAYAICVLIELQQLITWAPLKRLRDETPAAILLGRGFLWSDWLCYLVGVVIGAGVTVLVLRRARPAKAETQDVQNPSPAR